MSLFLCLCGKDTKLLTSISCNIKKSAKWSENIVNMR